VVYAHSERTQEGGTKEKGLETVPHGRKVREVREKGCPSLKRGNIAKMIWGSGHKKLSLPGEESQERASNERAAGTGRGGDGAFSGQNQAPATSTKRLHCIKYSKGGFKFQINKDVLNSLDRISEEQ